MSFKDAKKGERVFTVVVRRWNEVLDRPELYRGEVVGGGDTRVLYRWDDEDHRQSASRYQFENMLGMNRTEAAAWREAAVTLQGILLDARQTQRRAEAQLAEVERVLKELSQ